MRNNVAQSIGILRDTLRYVSSRRNKVMEPLLTRWLTCNACLRLNTCHRVFFLVDKKWRVRVGTTSMTDDEGPASYKRFADGTFANATNGVQFLNERWSRYTVWTHGLSAIVSSTYISSSFQSFLIKDYSNLTIISPFAIWSSHFSNILKKIT